MFIILIEEFWSEGSTSMCEAKDISLWIGYCPSLHLIPVKILMLIKLSKGFLLYDISSELQSIIDPRVFYVVVCWSNSYLLLYVNVFLFSNLFSECYFFFIFTCQISEFWSITSIYTSFNVEIMAQKNAVLVGGLLLLPWSDSLG